MSDSGKRTGRIAASLIGAVGVVLWATETMLVTLTTSIPPLQTVALAFTFAAAMSPMVWLLTGTNPLRVLRQPPHVWAVTVVSLVGYHGCIYYATQQAPPAAAALLQSTTPLMIVLASAFLPGERLRWWHVAGASLGFIGVVLLIETGSQSENTGSSFFYLALIGVAAALWGLYSVASRLLPDVPSTALGGFYAASAGVTLAAHLLLEPWVSPQPSQWLAIAALGIFPMGLAIYFWDFGVKRGDMQALGAFAYVEPFIGAVIVAVFTGAALSWSLLWSGVLVVTGAVIASASLWQVKRTGRIELRDPAPQGGVWMQEIAAIASEADLRKVTNRLIEDLAEMGRNSDEASGNDARMREGLKALAIVMSIWDGLNDIASPTLSRPGESHAAQVA